MNIEDFKLKQTVYRYNSSEILGKPIFSCSLDGIGEYGLMIGALWYPLSYVNNFLSPNPIFTTYELAQEYAMFYEIKYKTLNKIQNMTPEQIIVLANMVTYGKGF